MRKLVESIIDTLFFDLLKKKILEELILKSRESRESGQSKSQPLRELFKEKLEKKAQY